MTSKPVLLYLVTEDWYFLSHRLPMARAAREAGYAVHVATRVTRHADAIRGEGFDLHELNWRRGSFNPLGFVRAVLEIRRLYKNVKPALVHHVAMQPTVMGSLAAIGLDIRCINALAGLGFAFTSDTPRARFARSIMTVLLRILLNRRNSVVLVQNPDDRAAMKSLGVPCDKISLVPGSGVDTDELEPLPDPAGPVTAAFVGRLLDDKGVRALVEAHRRLDSEGRSVRLLIAGEPDPSNPASIPPDEIETWRQYGWIELLGHVADIREVWKRAHIAVLPSRREGLPKSLLEAAACGRPIVATDVPGCREIARQDINALLVPPDDPERLAAAIGRLAGAPDLRRRMGEASRALAAAEFSSDRIGRAIVALYEKLSARGLSGRPY